MTIITSTSKDCFQKEFLSSEVVTRAGKPRIWYERNKREACPFLSWGLKKKAGGDKEIDIKEAYLGNGEMTSKTARK